MNRQLLKVAGFFLTIAGCVHAQDVELPDTQQLSIPFTTPEQALSSLKLPTGFNATLFACEPNVIQPIAVTTDARGRLWVVECLTYSDRRQNYDLELNDRVIILEDVDHDGVFDRRTVFWDQGQKLTGIELGFGGVWLTAAPNLLFIPDQDQDDRPDGSPVVLLDGFNGDEIRHNIVNGLRWGPDGWLYGRHGIQATSHVGPPDAAPSQRIAMNCSIWRFHPRTHEFEIVVEGGTNPWGFDFDDHGEMFMINTVIGHMFHIVPGARYRRMYGAHFNPHTYQVIEQTADHFHWDLREPHTAVTRKTGMSAGTDAAGGGHAHTGLMCYLGDNWPSVYRNRWFTANFHGRRINVEATERDGCGYTARHQPDMIKSDDPWFRGIEMVYGPDGGVFLLDWSDIGECHENDGIHRNSGRIYKITYGQTRQLSDFDVSKWTDHQLVNCNLMENQWYVRNARRMLQQRFQDGRDMKPIESLLKSFIQKQKITIENSETADSRPLLRALWALHAVGAAAPEYLLSLCEVDDEHVRAWLIRLLADNSTELSAETKLRMTRMAAEDESGLVRLYLASALSRFELREDYEIFSALARNENDSNDRVQPHLIWYRLEPQVISNSEQAIQLVRDTAFPLLRENISRRLSSEIDTQPKHVEKLLALLSDSRADVIPDVVKGMKLALEGRTRVAKPATWDSVFIKITDVKDGSDRQVQLPASVKADIRKLNVIFGDGQGIAELRRIALDKAAPVESRRRAIVEYAATRPEQLFTFLKPLITDKSISNSVIRAMVYSDHSNVAKVILNRFGHLDPEGKILAINTLTSRSGWSQSLLAGVENGVVPVADISARHARQISEFDDVGLAATLSRVWGQVRTTNKARKDHMEKVRRMCEENAKLSLSKSMARYQVGKQIFAKKCANCHVIYGRGENVGPDLTGGDRKNMNYLLENIIDPNASVADSFRATKFILGDGRFVSGVVLQRTAQITRIQTATEIVLLDNREIEDFKPTNLSLMPDGLLENMSDDEIRALFHFLSKDR